MNSTKPLCSFILLSLCLLLLSQCTPTDSVMSEQPLDNPYPLSASTYLEQAQDSAEDNKQVYLLKAAGKLIHDGNWQRGAQLLRQVKARNTEQAREKRLLQATIDLKRNRPNNTIKTLSGIETTEDLSLYEKIQYHQLLARAYLKRQTPVNAVEERIKLETILPSENARTQNRRQIWLDLSKLPPATLTTLALEAEDGSDLQAWLKLAAIPRQFRYQPKAMIDAITQWQKDFSSHPGAKVLPKSLAQTATRLSTPPQQIALLLPLSGPVGGPGRAIRDGFMANFYQNKQAIPTKVRFYDTAKEEVTTLYQKALEEGADYVVGPLTKSNVEKIAQLTLPVRTLALNDIPKRKTNLYQFGLSPSDEAHQVALKARANGLNRALVIAPQGIWGDDILKAFNQSWRAQGGQLVDSLRFGESDDMNLAIKSFLRIDESETRQQQLKRVLGKKIKTQPRRRQDFDMIYLLAYPSKARQIQPMLKYYFAGDVPVYATSSVYAANTNPQRDRDLDGILFCDMPWVFNHPNPKATQWPEQLNSYSRLYALGLDSYALATQLNQLLLFPAMGVSDKTGVLYLKPDNQLSRLLDWAQFKNGKAEVLKS